MTTLKLSPRDLVGALRYESQKIDNDSLRDLLMYAADTFEGVLDSLVLPKEVYSVVVKRGYDQRDFIAAIRCVRQVQGCSLAAAKSAVESGPVVLYQGTQENAVARMREILEHRDHAKRPILEVVPPHLETA